MNTSMMARGRRLPSMHLPEVPHPTLSVVPPTRPSPAKQPRHLFVDNVRFWCMFSVVAIHGTQIFDLGQDQTSLVEIVLTPLKFGTIGFFLISGFLIGAGVQTSRPLEYLGRRVKKVFLPWLCWYLVYLGILLAADVIHHRLNLVPGVTLLSAILVQARFCLLYTAFWFVPNLLLSLCLLMLFKHYLKYRWFGALLFAVNIFYVVNIYRRWVPSSHTEAMFGFVFYLWLGTYACRHEAQLQQWIQRTSMAALLFTTIFLAFISYGETRVLDYLHSPTGTNTLRLSNQLFSIAAVLVLYKLQSATWPQLVDVRNNTFGIYLIHSPLLAVLHKLAKSRVLYPTVLHLMQTKAGSLFLWIVVTIITYFVSLALTKALASRRSLRWLVGVDTKRAPAL